MKTVEEIDKATNLLVIKNDEHGGYGIFRYGSLRNASVIWGRNEGGKYDHVSISPSGRTPTWEELCKVKDTFFNDDEECYQIFPKKREHVNLDKNCLHIWRNTEGGAG